MTSRAASLRAILRAPARRLIPRPLDYCADRRDFRLSGITCELLMNAGTRLA